MRKIHFRWNANVEPIKMGSLLMFRKAIENYLEFTLAGIPEIVFFKHDKLSVKEVRLVNDVFEDTDVLLSFLTAVETFARDPFEGSLNYYSSWDGIEHQIAGQKGRREMLWQQKSEKQFEKFISCHLRVPEFGAVPHIYHSQIANWFAFFEIKKDQKFLLLGDEMYPKKMLNLSNIVLAKREGLSLNQQLALIKDTKGFLGTASGFSAAAVLSNNPAFVFKHPKHHPDENITPDFLDNNQKQVRQTDMLCNIIRGGLICE
jgi:hypothetical protein